MFGYFRIAAACPAVEVAGCRHNAKEIISLMNKAHNTQVDIIVFPELSVTGYTCGDLFLQTTLLKSAEESLNEIIEASISMEMLIVIGMPVRVGCHLYNCAVAVCKGRLLGVVPKSYLPNTGEFYEKRWFSTYNGSGFEINLCGQSPWFGAKTVFDCKNHEARDLKIGIEICEDLWYVIPPSSYLALEGATVILNLSASNEMSSKNDYRHTLIKSQSARTYTAYCYAGSGTGESTTDVVFGGHCIIYENGKLAGENKSFQTVSHFIYSDIDVEMLVSERMKNKSFADSPVTEGFRHISFDIDKKSQELSRCINKNPFIPETTCELDKKCGEIFDIQISGLAKRLNHTKVKTAVIGVSGGLDSTLALLVLCRTYDSMKRSREDIIAVTMPGFGTTGRTYHNAIALMKELGVTVKEISIKEACIQHFKDIGHDPSIHDVTYENVQARERTQILMDIANKSGGIVIGTGDLSEIAMGWSTYNGDHMSMYSINCGVPKTLIRSLVSYAARLLGSETVSDILNSILDTPVSPELLPPDDRGEIEQKTEDIIGPYELHDFFLYYLVRYGFEPKKILYLACKAFNGIYDGDIIEKWLKYFCRRFFTQQFKRSCIPDGPKVGSVALSPRGDWKMPSDASFEAWIDET